MPIFEFVCQQCRHGFEEIMTHAQLEAGEAFCPACGSQKIERALSSFATGAAGASNVGGCGAPAGGCGSGFS